ncbi:MAG: hypothetical protein OQK12_10570 [Motiliproteus sp.]|nr:hypothetical protein [Motiliproteus sp.]
MDSTGWSKHSLIESYNESILFHLACAQHSFTREIAEVYRLDATAIDTLEQLETVMSEKGLEAPEAKELVKLRGDGQWLGNMLKAYQACWQAEEREQAENTHHASLSEIHVVQVNPDHTEEGAVIAQLEEWLNEFRELVERHRESMQEW